MKLGRPCKKCGNDDWKKRDDGAVGFRCVTCYPQQRLAAKRRRYGEDPEYRARTRKAVRLYARRNREKQKESSHAWYSKNREWVLSPENHIRRLCIHVRHTSKKRGVPFALTDADILAVWTERCPYFGTPWGLGPHRPSLDRIIPKLGYVPGNIEVISWRANVIKNDGSAAEHAIIAQRLAILEAKAVRHG